GLPMKHSVFVTIPGKPLAQGRPRGTVVNGRVRMYDPKASRDWQGSATWLMVEAAKRSGWKLTHEPVAVVIHAIFPCPKGDYRKGDPRPRRWHTKRGGDADNIAKAVLDAGNGVLWHDDCQVANLNVHTMIGAQDEPPAVEIMAWNLRYEP